jgi:hypothetical protein
MKIKEFGHALLIHGKYMYRVNQNLLSDLTCENTESLSNTKTLAQMGQYFRFPLLYPLYTPKVVSILPTFVAAYLGPHCL